MDSHEQLFVQCQPEQGGVLPGPEEVLDEHPVVQLERERLHGVVDDRHLKQKSKKCKVMLEAHLLFVDLHLAEIATKCAEVFDVVGLEIYNFLFLQFVGGFFSFQVC